MHRFLLFAVLLSAAPSFAQVTGGGGGTANACIANVANPTAVRIESTSDLLGDIVIMCATGAATPAGQPIPPVDITVALPVGITSRTYANGWSEATLIFDEAGAPFVPGAGAQQLACVTGICAITGTGTGGGTYDGTLGRPNVFSGKVGPGVNIITFPSVPLDLPPPGFSRILRITNLRANVSGITLPPGAVTMPINASVTMTGGIQLSNPSPIVAFGFNGLTFSSRTPDNLAVSPGATFCPSAAPVRTGVLRFAEGFGNSFRSRTSQFVDPQTSPSPAAQNVPGGSSPGVETGFFAPALTSQVVDYGTVGLASFGTRLRARFDNVPAGTQIYVSTQRVSISNTNVASVSNAIGVATLVADELAPFAPAAAATVIEGIAAAGLAVSNGSASAVWEVLQDNPAGVENFEFLYWVSSTQPGATPTFVRGSFAPASPAVSLIDGGLASPTLPVPRFLPPSSTSTAFTVNNCVPPALSISKTHAGTTVKYGQRINYTLTVSNAPGAGTANNTFTASELPPAGMQLVSMSGSGWNCASGFTCTRTDTLPAGVSLPPITVAADVLPVSGTPAPVVKTNTAALSLGILDVGSAMDPVTVSGSCSYAFGAPSATVPAVGGPVSVSITTTPECSSMLIISTAWVSAVGGPGLFTNATPPVLGSGTVSFTVDPNPTIFNRTTLLTIAGTSQRFTITQLAGPALPPTVPTRLQFVPIPPCRVVDTRNAFGPLGGPVIPDNTSRDFNVPSSPCGIPATAQAYSLNVTTVPVGALGFLSIWPAGQLQPVVSTLNSDGRIKANAAIVPAGLNGAISVYVTNSSHVIIDVNGYFEQPTGPQDLAFYSIAPCRLADTRFGSGSFGQPSLAAQAPRTLPVLSGPCGIPATAKAYATNMTVVPHGALGFLSAWPAGQSQPVVSTLNALTGAITANMAIVPAGVGGAISVFATDDTDLIVDITGYFAPPGAPGSMDFYAVSPCRISDTRNPVSAFGGPVMGAAEARSLPVPSSACGIPAGAAAYSLNATVVPPAPLGFLGLWGSGPQPFVSTLNAGDGSVVANAAITPAGAGGAVTAFTSNPSHLILDINGYFK